MKLEQLKNGNWLINGVEYAPVEDEKDRLINRLQAESEGWEVFFSEGQEPDQEYQYEVHVFQSGTWETRINDLHRLDPAECRTIYRRRLKRPKELPAQPIDPDQLPVRVTLRCGKHYTATQLSISGECVLCVEKDSTKQWITISIDGFFLECKKPSDYDIIRVGKWLSTEELEVIRK